MHFSVVYPGTSEAGCDVEEQLLTLEGNVHDMYAYGDPGSTENKKQEHLFFFRSFFSKCLH